MAFDHYSQQFASKTEVAFEIWVRGLLRARYGHGRISTSMPERESGDGGIDALDLTTGTIYQMYGPRDLLDNKSNEENLANKINMKIKRSANRLSELMPRHGGGVRRVIIISRRRGEQSRFTARILLKVQHDEAWRGVDFQEWGERELWDEIRLSSPDRLRKAIASTDYLPPELPAIDELSCFEPSNTTEIWNPENQSAGYVDYEPVGGEVREAVVKHLMNVELISEDQHSDAVVDQVGGTGSSKNFRVKLKDESFLFRVEQRMNDSTALQEILKITAHLVERKVSPLVSFISPEIAWNPKYKFRGRISAQMGDDSRFSAIFRHLDHDRFVPCNIEEVKAAGLCLGRLLDALSDYEPKQVKTITDRRSDLVIPEDLGEQWQRLTRESKHLKDAGRLDRSSPAQLARMLVAECSHLADELGELHQTNAPLVVTYADLHPHNLLVHREENQAHLDAMKLQSRLVICDIESCVATTSQDASIGFAAHRFAREYSIRNWDATKTEQTIRRFIDAFRTFVRAVTENSNQPTDQELGEYARAARRVNLNKALIVACEQLGQSAVIFSTKGSLESVVELRKLLRYCIELRAIELIYFDS